MRDLSGRVERLERKLSAVEDGVLVLEVPYCDDLQAAQQRVLEEKGLTPSDIGNRLIVFITNFSSEPH